MRLLFFNTLWLGFTLIFYFFLSARLSIFLSPFSFLSTNLTPFPPLDAPALKDLLTRNKRE